MGKSKKSKKAASGAVAVASDVKETVPKKTEPTAKKTKKKTKKTVTFKQEDIASKSVEIDLLHEPCGEGQAIDIQHLVKKGEKKPIKPKPTYDDGLQVNWRVHIGDNVHPYHSVRAMAVGLNNLGYNVGNTEKIRAFIRRRRMGTKGKNKSYLMFDGIDHIYREGGTDDLLADRPGTDSSSDSSSSSDSDCEAEAASMCVVA
mgnify:CR=1 FL=1|tara:strand:+ start:74 stop:679 length:606 start_codon:yes stop_codon:yes gene_type:complete